jgi:hypothetical protein
MSPSPPLTPFHLPSNDNIGRDNVKMRRGKKEGKCKKRKNGENNAKNMHSANARQKSHSQNT